MTSNQQVQYRHHDRSPAMAMDELTLTLFDRLIPVEREYADQRAHDVFWMTAAQRNAYNPRALLEQAEREMER